MAMIPPWEPEQQRYALSERVYLLKADKIEWGIYSSVYYNAEYNGFFKDQGYEYEGWRDPFWIYEGEALIGGVVIAPNVMFTLFFIPPFRDERRIVLLLKEALISWSDLSKDIIIFEVLPDQVELLGRAGFWPSAFRCRWMQRPTEAFEVKWEDCFVVETPEMIQQDGINQLRNENDIARLLYRSFAGAGSIDAIRRQQTDMQFYQEDIREYVSYTNDLVRNASTIVVDSHTNEVVGACLVSMQGSYPAIYNIAVHPSYSGQGIATRMLQTALSNLKGHYPVLRLYVMQGNTAESVYYNLGFMPGPIEVQRMYIPAQTDRLDSNRT